ncbi:MAG: GrpB family protein [Actinobacteria bacterium]|nr:GrpB family protein [Actinomycetota bacterium]
MSVEVVEYDDAWPARFTAEADQIRAALGPELRRIDHVGSTSVPGLAAKPIIDIALSVEAFDTLDIEALEELGYRYACAYDEQLPNRRHFSKLGYHLHAYEQEHEEFLDYVRFRDYLRTHDEDRDAYGTLKLRLAQDHERAEYQNAKSAFVARLVEMLRRG